ncbi:hypothetical protein HMPREF0185_01756 [Brevundimonas diminuta 470-4]|nr:hypothetical protein HMPREF0185_01756 [Brevundimonas diminuta 470-4]
MADGSARLCRSAERVGASSQQTAEADVKSALRGKSSDTLFDRRAGLACACRRSVF